MKFVEKYKSIVHDFLPKGKLWEKIACNIIWQGIVQEFSRIEERAEQLLIRELDPCFTLELLPDWERLLGIPDDCTVEGLTIEERRNNIKERLARRGSISAEYFESIGKTLGFNIKVNDCNEFLVGHSTVGQPLCNSHRLQDVFTVGDHTVGQALKVFSWRYYFQVAVPIGQSSNFNVGQNTVGQPLRVFGNETIECTIRKLKPTHVGVVFSFIE